MHCEDDKDKSIYNDDMDKQERVQFREACYELRQIAIQSHGDARRSDSQPNPTNPHLYKPVGGDNIIL